ncbi:MAG: MotA/TolQ/ExbB proton channel family protein [Candidatus Methylacidiphilales bacterium]|nr:MotA/TolQ/ExbB proton channel family protein [Candidatus Methylacidiphilales bacterium]
MKIHSFTYHASSIGCSLGLFLFSLSSLVGAESPGHVAVMRSAMEDLASAEKSLTALRKSIELERIPLTDNLAALETKLSELRKVFEEKQRAYDTAGLDRRKAELEIKARTEENTYLGNLVDEFILGLETRIHPAELPQHIAKITEAKLAPENNNLSTKEKFAVRAQVVDLAFNRLINIHKLMKFPASALDASGTVVDGTAALIGPVAVFYSQAGVPGLLIGQPGAGRPILRILDPALGSGIKQLVESGQGIIPYDPTKGGALSAFLKKASLVEKFIHGGPIMWPILICSIIGVAVSIERMVYFFFKNSQRNKKSIDAIFQAIHRGSIQEAINAGNQSKDYVAKVMAYALSHQDHTLQTAITAATAKEMKRWTARLWMLDTVITMAPLLGLLGTVVGMMGSFEGMGGTDAASGTTAITGGIAEALIATAFGLCIAIFALIPLNFLNDRIEEAQHELEHAGRELELAIASAGARHSNGGHEVPGHASVPVRAPVTLAS